MPGSFAHLPLGPVSYLSIISAPALSWIEGRAGSMSLKENLVRLGQEIHNILTMDGDLQQTRVPEPDDQTAWEYTKGTCRIKKMLIRR